MSAPLDIDQLQTFVAIADTGSFTKAADRVFKTQSAVSMQMRRLEERIGKPLFMKDGRGNRLTVEGDRLLNFARRMIRLNNEAIASFDDFRSAQEIHELLGERGEAVGLATVYRTLQRLADAGEVDRLLSEDGEAIYRACSRTHHHHLVCRGCGRTVEVEGPAVERWTRSIAAEHGFEQVSHTLEIFGTCPSCA